MKFFLLLLLACNVSLLNAQPSTKFIFEQAINKIKTLKSVSYTINSANGNMFSKDDVTRRKTQVSVLFKRGVIDYKLREVSDDKDTGIYNEVYRDGKSYTFDMTDSTYSLDQAREPDYDLSDFANLLNESLREQSNKIIRKTDTVYQNIACYSFMIKTYDTLSNGQHDFTHKYILINKNNFLPVSLKEKGEGTASKGGYVMGRIFVNNEDIYSNIKVNAKIVSSPISFAGFYLKNTKMLSIGDDSPQLNIKTLLGDVVDESFFKNKILLVVFGSITCPANPLANPVLNRLHTKYKGENFAILNIFTSETGEQVKKYIEANNLYFNSYLSTRKQHSDFKVISSPNFYIINNDRKIKTAIDGYSDKLENQLIKLIDELLASY
jgi:thiol-disulfide isomerase/thioredoxin/outer membrane lipoprotein-sorting protein